MKFSNTATTATARTTFSNPLVSRRIILTALAMLSLAGRSSEAGSSTPPADVFAGLWAVTVTPNTSTAQRGVQTFDDKLLFEENKLTAEACAKYGLAPSPYTLTVSAISGKTYFTSEMESDTQGKMTWTGMISLSGLHGKLVWTKTDGSVNTYQLSGKRTQVVAEVIQPDPEPEGIP